MNQRGRKVNEARKEIISNLINTTSNRDQFVVECQKQLKVSEGSATVYWYKNRKKDEVVGSEYKEKFEKLVGMIQDKLQEAKEKKKNTSVFKELLELV